MHPLMDNCKTRPSHRILFQTGLYLVWLVGTIEDIVAHFHTFHYVCGRTPLSQTLTARRQVSFTFDRKPSSSKFPFSLEFNRMVPVATWSSMHQIDASQLCSQKRGGKFNSISPSCAISSGVGLYAPTKNPSKIFDAIQNRVIVVQDFLCVTNQI